MIGGDPLAVDFNGVRVHKTSEALNDIDVIFAQHVVIRRMNAVDIGGAARHQLLPVEMVDGGVKAVIRAIQMDRLGDLRGVPHDFFRYAAHVDAGAAQRFGFNQGAFLAVHGRTVDRSDTATAAADGEVVVVSGHGCYLLMIRINAIVVLTNRGSTYSCDYSGTTHFSVVWPVPAGTSALCSHGNSVAICCSSFHGGLMTIMPEAVMPR